MLIERSREYFIELYDYIVKNKIELGTMIKYDSTYIVIDAKERFNDYVLVLAKQGKRPNDTIVDLKTLKLGKLGKKRTDIEIDKFSEINFETMMRFLSFVKSLKDGAYYRLSDKILVFLDVQSDLNKILYYEILVPKSCKNIEKYISDRQDELVLHYVNFGVLNPLFDKYKKLGISKELFALGLKLKISGIVC